MINVRYTHGLLAVAIAVSSAQFEINPTTVILEKLFGGLASMANRMSNKAPHTLDT